MYMFWLMFWTSISIFAWVLLVGVALGLWLLRLMSGPGYRKRPVITGLICGLGSFLAMSSWPLAFVFVGMDPYMVQWWFWGFEGAAVVMGIIDGSIDGSIVGAVALQDRARRSQENRQ